LNITFKKKKVALRIEENNQITLKIVDASLVMVDPNIDLFYKIMGLENNP